MIDALAEVLLSERRQLWHLPIAASRWPEHRLQLEVSRSDYAAFAAGRFAWALLFTGAVTPLPGAIRIGPRLAKWLAIDYHRWSDGRAILSEGWAAQLSRIGMVGGYTVSLPTSRTWPVPAGK